MTEYTLVVTQLRDNPDYESQMDRASNYFGGGPGSIQSYPQKRYEHEVLRVTVSAETFAAIRKAAVESL